MPYHITPDGVPLYYLDEGQGAPIILIHGWTMNHKFFDRNIPVLARDHRVVALDLRGHGSSGKQESGWTLPQAARDVHGLIETLGLDGVTLVGWSMGMTVVHHYFDQFSGERLKGAVSVDMTPYLFVEDGWDHGVFGTLDRKASLELERDIVENRLEVEHGFIPACFADAQVPDEATREWWLRESMIPSTPAMLAYWVSMSAYDFRRQLPATPVPLLLCYGARSAIYPTPVGNYIAGQVPDGDLVTFEHSGHSPFWEEAPKFNDVVGHFAR